MIHNWLDFIPMTVSDAHSSNRHWWRVYSGPGSVHCPPCSHSCFFDVSCRVIRHERQHEFWSLLPSAFMSASEKSLWEFLGRAEKAGDLSQDAEAFLSVCLEITCDSWVTGLNFMGSYWISLRDCVAFPWAQSIKVKSAFQWGIWAMMPGDSFWNCSRWGNMFGEILRDIGSLVDLSLKHLFQIFIQNGPWMSIFKRNVDRSICFLSVKFSRPLWLLVGGISRVNCRMPTSRHAFPHGQPPVSKLAMLHSGNQIMIKHLPCIKYF